MYSSRSPHYKDPYTAIRAISMISQVHRKYIELNTNFRTLAKNEFKKKLFKLMNNAVFDKTMENMRNHANVRLVMHWDKRYGVEAMIAKPNFQ